MSWLIPLFLVLHLLAAIGWVGGMLFAHVALRPSAMALEPPVRLALWQRVFSRFFPLVWLCVITLLVTGTDSTLPIRLWAMMRLGFTPDINALVAIILGLTIALCLVAVRQILPAESEQT